MAGAEDLPATGLERPTLTFPPEVAAIVSAAYGKASCILEYGSGGSTVLAYEMPGKTIYAVESDRDWAEQNRKTLPRRGPRSGYREERQPAGSLAVNEGSVVARPHKLDE